jgi:hypothetical protein
MILIPCVRTLFGEPAEPERPEADATGGGGKERWA